MPIGIFREAGSFPEELTEYHLCIRLPRHSYGPFQEGHAHNFVFPHCCAFWWFVLRDFPNHVARRAGKRPRHERRNIRKANVIAARAGDACKFATFVGRALGKLQSRCKSV